MKKIIIFIFILASALSFSQRELIGVDKSAIKNFNKLEEIYANDWKNKDIPKIKGRKQFQRFQNFWKYRTTPNGFIPNVAKLYNEYSKLKTKSAIYYSRLSGNDWKLIGPIVPSLDDEKKGVGRINCINFSPIDSNIIWAGSASGGLWLSKDKGLNWEVAPGTDFLGVGVSDIQISKSNPNIIYVATGDLDGGRFFGSFSLGLLKSTDSGKTWDTTGYNYAFQNQSFISKVLIHPKNPNILYVAGSNSIAKSSDAGQTWATLIDGEFFVDLTFSPDTPEELWASTMDANGGALIYNSKDSGDTWYSVKSIKEAARIKLAVDPFDSETVYALTSHFQTTEGAGLYVTHNSGITWDTLKLKRDIVEKQGYYNLVLSCSPYKKGEIYAGGVGLFKILNGGVKKFDGAMHVDQHCLAFNPFDSALYVGNDGGVYKIDKNFSDCTPFNKNLSITQFYNLAINEFTSNNIYGGSQDNGFWEMKNGKWNLFTYGDGMKIEHSLSLPLTLYCAEPTAAVLVFKDGVQKRLTLQSINEKQNWETAFCVDFSRPDTVYICKENVYMANLSKDSVYTKISNFDDGSPINKIEIDRLNPNILIVANGKYVYSTSNCGQSWNKISDSKGYISSVFIDHGTNNYYWTLGGFDPLNKIFYYKGDSTINLTYDAPNVPFNKIIKDTISNILYAACDFGVLQLNDTAKSWSFVGEKLPPTIITDLVINYGSGELLASSFGRGVWSYSLREKSGITPKIKIIGNNPLCEDDSCRFIIENPEAGVEYLWNDGSKGIENIYYKNKIKSGKTDVWVSANYKDGSIKTSEFVQIKLDEKLNESIFLLSGNPICEGESANLIFYKYDQLKKAGYKIIWNTGDTSAQINPKLPGEYFVSIVSPNLCVSKTNSITIATKPKPQKPNIVQSGKILTTEFKPGYKYQWVMDGYIVTGGSQNVLNLLETAKYKVVVTDTNFCTNVSDEIEGFVNPIDTAEQASIKVFPIPTSDKITIRAFCYDKRDLSITINDLLGKELFNINVADLQLNFEKEIYLNTFSQGTYFVNYTFGNKKGRITFIKEN